MSAPHGLPPARPMQAYSHLRGLSASSNRPSGPPPPIGKAPVSGRSSRAGAAGGGDGGTSPRVTTPRGNAAALAAASSVLGGPAAPSAPPPVPRIDGERMQHQQGQQQQGRNSSGGGQQGPPPPPGASFEGGRAAAMSGKPELTGGPHRGKEKRQYIFRNKYLDDARDSARRLQLLDLVKMLSASNIRQADEIDALRRKQQELEKRLEQFAPLEGLLHFMEDSEDPRLVSMLAPAPKQPGRGKAIRTGGGAGGVTFSGDRIMALSDYGAAAAAAHPPETQVTARLVSEKVLALMRLCGDGEGVEDEELLREVREVESAMMGVRVQEHRARMTGGGGMGSNNSKVSSNMESGMLGLGEEMARRVMRLRAHLLNRRLRANRRRTAGQGTTRGGAGMLRRIRLLRRLLPSAHLSG